MSIQSEKIWKSFREGGLWLAVFSLCSTLVFGVIDHLTGGVIPKVSNAISDYFWPPTYMVTFTVPVEIDTKQASFRPLPFRERRDIKIIAATSLYIELTGDPGDYSVTFSKPDKSILPTILRLKRDENPPIDTADSKWSRPEILQRSVAEIQSPDTSRSGSGVLSEVRWSVAASDLDQISAARTKEARTILTTALREIGTNERGDSTSRERIYSYWSVIPILRQLNGITPDNLGPWGGAFLTWVIKQSNLDPPSSAAAYNSWTGWAQAADTDNPEPGMVALFATKAVPGLRGSYLAGIVLRKRIGCTEIVTGNIADRVVIACVNLPIAILRHA